MVFHIPQSAKFGDWPDPIALATRFLSQPFTKLIGIINKRMYTDTEFELTIIR